MIKKGFIAISYITALWLIYLFGSDLLFWMETAGMDKWIWVVAVATLMALFPIIPFPIVGGVIGAAFGSLVGGVMIWIASSLASYLMFLVFRYGYHDVGQKLLSQSRFTGRMTAFFEKNAFIAIVLTRMIPVIPSIIINIYSAMSKVRTWTYTIASCLGKVPAMMLFAMVGHFVVTDPKQIVITVAAYAFFMLAVYAIYAKWQKNVQST